MIIGIDTRMPTKNKTGIAYMIDNIVSVLVKYEENQYNLFGYDFNIQAPNIKTFHLPHILQRGVNFFWKYLRFPPANIFIGKVDAFLFSNFSDFPIFSKKRLLMVPDLSFIKYPQFTQKKNLNFLKKNVGQSIKRADSILTISKNAKEEIVQYYKVPEEKISVIYPGCPKNIHRVIDKPEIEKVKKEYGISGDYILFVGTLEPRKNIEGLILAYNRLSNEIKNNYKLIICGGKGWYYDKIFTLVNDLGLTDRVVFTGYAKNQDLSSLYSGASVFAFPSFYEGFGLPILEAFTCGVPVVVASNSSLLEVGGEAVIYCDAENIETIKNGIEKVLLDKNLKTDLAEKGYEQLKNFSWDRSAEKILEIIKN